MPIRILTSFSIRFSGGMAQVVELLVRSHLSSQMSRDLYTSSGMAQVVEPGYFTLFGSRGGGGGGHFEVKEGHPDFFYK